MKKRLEGAALELPPGHTPLGPCKPEFWKKWPLNQLFLLHILLQSIINLHWLFNLSNINTHFDMFSKIKACMSVIYFLICVRKHKSNLPTKICTTAGEENTMQKNATFWVKPHSCLILWQRGVFFMTKVCVFYQWCLSCFSSQHYVSMSFVNSVGKKIHTLPRYALIFPYQMP